MPNEEPIPNQPETTEKPVEEIPASVTRPADEEDVMPPMVSPARGPMNQSTPDVPTGSTPLTRHDD